MSNLCKIRCSRIAVVLSSVIIIPFVATIAFAQAADEADDQIEEIVVTGSHIKGAKITGALAVSVIDAGDIEVLGFDSGDELLQFMAEQGVNYFNNIDGNVNNARGDVGAYNLRDLGTGNTLVLLNGRRMVNAASYQTEEVGGSFVPVNTVNAQSLPVFGLERVEVLRDGASAIYGADAVAGVVNYVLKRDFEGFNLRTRFSEYDHLSRQDQRITLEWGKNFNGGSTNLSIFADYYHRDSVSTVDDARWSNSDFRDRLPEGSPWKDGILISATEFRNDSSNSEFGQYDVLRSVSSFGLTGDLWDSAGDIETFPIGHEDCDYVINATTCGAVDGNGTYRHNLNHGRDLLGELDRTNVYAFLNHEFANGVESFTEFSMYLSDTLTTRSGSTRQTGVDNYEMAADAYWNPFGPCGSDNRIPDMVTLSDGSVVDTTGIPCEGIVLKMENHRYASPTHKIVDNSGDTFRVLQGFRGLMGAWDWDTAVVWSRATKSDLTHNRVSSTLLQEALDDTTPAGYNPFGGLDNNGEQFLIDVRRDNETELKMFDFKLSRNDLFEIPAGPVGFLAGIELRQESFIDDRDPRLDGTIRFIDNNGLTYPFVSDVMGSSATADSSGDRDVFSLFGELQIPLLESLDVQLAVRYEDFSDIGDATVGKFAFGWRPIEQLLFRGSWSESFRVPNLVTVNESLIARTNTRSDFVCFHADPDQDVIDCDHGVQRTAAGSADLVSETSDNTSIGIVFEPFEGLTLTLDYWEIVKTNTIGLFGEENHSAFDLMLRIANGLNNCATFVGDPAVIYEDASTLDAEETQLYLDAGICPAGSLIRVNDTYANLDERTVQGSDLGIFYNVDTGIGNFDVRLLATFLEKFEQIAGGDAAILVAAKESGALPNSVPVTGFASLIRQDGYPRSKQTIRVIWNNGPWGASISGIRLDDVIMTDETLDDGTLYILPSMTTYNGTVSYRFNWRDDSEVRIRLGVRNLTDERAPLADKSYGYFRDMHNDYGINYYLDLKAWF
ncbi:MAG: TonB-dependent receptor [Gammaproteobacteria bacterium]|nr:TonB-dependent receptor [Gammaproteobacteria bacterium]